MHIHRPWGMVGNAYPFSTNDGWVVYDPTDGKRLGYCAPRRCTGRSTPGPALPAHALQRANMSAGILAPPSIIEDSAHGHISAYDGRGECLPYDPEVLYLPTSHPTVAPRLPTYHDTVTEQFDRFFICVRVSCAAVACLTISVAAVCLTLYSFDGRLCSRSLDHGLLQSMPRAHGTGTDSDDVKKGQKPKKVVTNKSKVTGGGNYAAITAAWQAVPGDSASQKLAYIRNAYAKAREKAPSASQALSSVRARIKKVMGSGDYISSGMGEDGSVMRNSLIKGSVSPDASFTSTGDHVVMCRRECAGTITADNPGVFTTYAFDVAIANRALFIAGSTMAKLYERVIILGLIFELESEFLRMSTDGSQGTWGITCMENPYSQDLQSDIALYNTNGAAAGSMSKNLMFGVECARDKTVPVLYTDRESVTEKAFHTLCRMQLSTTAPAGITTGTVIGRLFVAYHAAFRDPKFPLYVAPTLHIVGTGADGAHLFGTSNTLTARGGFYNTTLGVNTISFGGCAVGDLLKVEVRVLGTSATNNLTIASAVSGNNALAGSGCIVPYLDNSSSFCAGFFFGNTNITSVNSGVASTRFGFTFPVLITRVYPPPVVTFASDGVKLVTPTAASVDVQVVLVSAGNGPSSGGQLFAAPAPQACTLQCMPQVPQMVYPIIGDEGAAVCEHSREYVSVDRLSQEEIELIETMRRARLADK